MAGHNKWSKVKRYKAVADKKRGALFSRMLKEIMVAAKNGKDPDGNARLRKAINDAKAESVPKENIERAIKKGAGELDGGQVDELIYEGYGPGGVAVLVEVVTDNRLRTQPEIRKIFELNGGNLGEQGSVAWGFQKKGIILVSKDQASEEQLMGMTLEVGAEDINASEDGYEVLMSPENFEAVRLNLEKAGIKMELAEISNTPTNKVKVSGDTTAKIESLLEELEEHDDVQRVTSNADIG